MTKLMLSIVLQLQPFPNICLELHIDDPRFVFIAKCRASPMGFYLQEAYFSHFGLLQWEITSKQVRFSSFTDIPPLSAPLLIHHMVSRERSGSTVMRGYFRKSTQAFVCLQVVISSHKYKRKMSGYVLFYFILETILFLILQCLIHSLG